MLDYFLVFSMLLSLLFSLGELNVKVKSTINYYLFIIFLLLALFQFNSYLWSSELIITFPHFLYIHIPSVLLLGPILERYLNKMWDHNLDKFSGFLKKCFFSISYFFLFIPNSGEN